MASTERLAGKKRVSRRRRRAQSEQPASTSVPTGQTQPETPTVGSHGRIIHVGPMGVAVYEDGTRIYG